MAVISKANAEALLARQDVNEIIEEAQRTSAALATFRTVRMSAGTTRMPVLSALPTAGWVTDNTEAATSTKPTSSVAWKSKELIAEEIAVIVPIHENVFDDSSFNVWAEVRPLVAQEFGRVLDSAVLFGTNKPVTWVDASLEDGARTAGNVRSAAAAGDLAEDVNQVWATVEADGYDVNVQYAARSLRAQLRGLRDTNGQPIYSTSLKSDGTSAAVYGEEIFYVTNGAWEPATAGTPNTGATLIAGDRTKAILGVRQDMTFKILTEATVGGYNLAEKDMIGLRAKLRVGFAVADPINPEGGAGAYPFGILDV